MAKAKYIRGKDGYFKTNIWDGTYKNGKKHYVSIRSKKSSRDLELSVESFHKKLEQGSLIKKTSYNFVEYACHWKKTYKAGKSHNTNAMYENIIEKHLIPLKSVPLNEVSREHFQLVINNAMGKKRTQQQIIMTFKQIIKSAIADKLLPPTVFNDIFETAEKIRYKAPKKRALYDYEEKALFSANLSQRDKCMLYILYGCGLRREELLALTKKILI